MSQQRTARFQRKILLAAIIPGVAMVAQNTSEVRGGEKMPAAPAQLVVRLADDATLYIDDTKYEGRSFDTPPLEPGWDYSYTLRVEMAQNGKTISVTRHVTVRAGHLTAVDFRDANAPIIEPPSKIVQAAANGEPGILPEEQEVIDQINAYRTQMGLAPLKANPLLCQISRRHSEDMARVNRLGHVLNGKGPSQRCAEAGYSGYTGENCAGGSGSTPTSFFRLWVNSSGHRRNMLGNHTEVGVGFAANSGGSHYYTALFGVGQ